MQSKSLVDAAFEHAAAIPSSAEHGPASRAPLRQRPPLYARPKQASR